MYKSNDNKTGDKDPKIYCIPGGDLVAGDVERIAHHIRIEAV